MESCGFERGFKSSDTIAVQCYGGSRQWYSSFSGAGCGLLAHRYETTPNQNHTKEYSSHHFSFEETSFTLWMALILGVCPSASNLIRTPHQRQDCCSPRHDVPSCMINRAHVLD